VFGRIKKNGLKRPFPTFEIFRARTSGTDSDLNQQALKNFQFPISHFQLGVAGGLVSSGSLAANV
jgi:hypothetical protein